MEQKTVRVGNLTVNNQQQFVLFGGMNVLESRDMAMRIAEHYVTVCARLGIPLVIKRRLTKRIARQCILTGDPALKKA